NEVVGDEKHQQAEIHFEVLFHDGRAFFEEQSFAGLRAPDPIGRVPGLPAGDHVHQVIRVGPKRELLVADPTGVFGEKKLTDLELIKTRIRADTLVEVQHTSKVGSQTFSIAESQ